MPLPLSALVSLPTATTTTCRRQAFAVARSFQLFSAKSPLYYTHLTRYRAAPDLPRLPLLSHYSRTHESRKQARPLSSISRFPVPCLDPFSCKSNHPPIGRGTTLPIRGFFCFIAFFSPTSTYASPPPSVPLRSDSETDNLHESSIGVPPLFFLKPPISARFLSLFLL